MVSFPQAAHDLAQIVGPDAVTTVPDVLAAHSVDGAHPGAVVYPADTARTAAVVKYANQHGLAVVPWGGGTKMGIGHPPKQLDLIVCTARMNRMIDLDAANLTATVEAGVRLADLQAGLAAAETRFDIQQGRDPAVDEPKMCTSRPPKSVFLPLDPPFADRCTVGGAVACNASGPRRLLYGSPRDLIIGVRFVAPTGEVVGMGGKTVKNVSGYDVSKLMVGALGSLGLICELTLRLLPRPERMETRLFNFETLADIRRFTDRIFDSPLLPAAVEVINPEAFSLLQSTARPSAAGTWTAAVALETFDPAVQRMHREIQQMAASCSSRSTAVLSGEDHCGFWLQLGNISETAAARCPDTVTAQLSFPISEWPNIVDFTVRRMAEQNLQCALLAHAGVGICRIDVLPAGGDAAGTVSAVSAVLDHCCAVGGNMIIQHASPKRKPYLPMWGTPGGDRVVVERLKRELDPAGVMNPGRFVGGL